MYHAFQQLIICLLIKTFIKIGGITTMNKVIELRAWKSNKVFQELQRERDFEREQSIINGDIRTLSEIIDLKLKGLQHEHTFLFQGKIYEWMASGKDGSVYSNNIDNSTIQFYCNEYKKFERVALRELFSGNEQTIYDKQWTIEQTRFMFNRFGLKPLKKMEKPKTISEIIKMLEHGKLLKKDFLLQDSILFRGDSYKFGYEYDVNDKSSVNFRHENHFFRYITFYFYKSGEFESIHLHSPNIPFEGEIYNYKWTIEQKKEALKALK